jgi:hypothetical protein
MSCAGECLMPHFTCPVCGAFNGLAKEDLQACRACGAGRPIVLIIEDFIAGVRTEAPYQRALWGSEHDLNKTHADWFWLVGYLAGKALSSAMRGERDKALHHTITAAAALHHWHDAIKRGAIDGRAV